MATSEEVYHRVRWDPRFDPARFVVGINQRGAAPKRVPLPRFVPGGDIPWHRVLFFEADGEVVWDRTQGVDLMDTSTAGRVRHARLLRAPFFTAAAPHAWDRPTGRWRPVEPEPRAVSTPAAMPGQAGDGLRLLTWNTLWDRYDPDRIDTARRRPLLLAALAEARADVIALQEVEPALLAMLLDQPWIRAEYTVDTDPRGREVDDHGLLLLSRLPVREAGRHALGPHKAVSAITVETAHGPLVVAATHLTSDHADDGPARRRVELADLAEGLAGVDGDLVLMGDFNDGDAGPAGPAAVLGLRDAWAEVHGRADRTPTFDPTVNPLAAVSSRSGRASRLDRILLRGAGLRPDSAMLRGDSPGPGGLHVSDHYGVEAAVALGTGELRWPPEDRPEHEPGGGLRPGAAGMAGGGAPQKVMAGDPGTRARLTRDLLAAALPEGRVEVVGSRRMGCALSGADLDLVAALPGPVHIERVQDRVTAALPDATRVRQVQGARVPGLRLHHDGLDIDLVVASAGAIAPADAVRRRQELGLASSIALSAVADADAVNGAVAGNPAGFTALARSVKAWARARGLDSAPFGGLPGLAWAVLAARVVAEAGDVAGDVPPEELIRSFFARWAAWDWYYPVDLTGAAGTTEDPGARPGETATAALPAPVVILTPADPIRNCAERVGAGGRDLLTHELYRAWEILEDAARDGGDPWSRLLEPPPMHRRHGAWLAVTVRAGGGEALDQILGRFRGRIGGLLGALEHAGARDAHAWPRPFAQGPGHARYAIGLGLTVSGSGGDGDRIAHIAELARHWSARLPGVTVEIVESRAVPTLR